ncbi:hypothetical protein BZG36_05684 [Bifiguratus adelaidae]|uniref:Uncharacterized protein n=1 Tax=Bifiguratus adelaidae TaxID=1938954 RepID=A0A261XSL2_9FUNG|nr:hypothetical protein BZG36_05684 [Bifiguratus adelaidae]
MGDSKAPDNSELAGTEGNVKESIKQREIDVREYRVRSTNFIERITGGIMSEERASAKLQQLLESRQAETSQRPERLCLCLKVARLSNTKKPKGG